MPIESLVLIYLFVQSNSFMEGVSQKIRRQIEELERVSGVESGGLTVDGVPVDSYLTRFRFSFDCWICDLCVFSLCVCVMNFRVL